MRSIGLVVSLLTFACTASPAGRAAPTAPRATSESADGACNPPPAEGTPCVVANPCESLRSDLVCSSGAWRLAGALPQPKASDWPEQQWNPQHAATPASARMIRTLIGLQTSVAETRYQHRLNVRKKDGLYGWDCSLMVAWVMRRSAPVALRALGENRPLAKHFFHMIDRAPLKTRRRGWQKLAHVSDAKAGDLFAWLRSPLSTSNVSGHVGIFVHAPAAVPGMPNAYVARIVDATSLPHQDDTRANDGPGGFGFGTFLFVTDHTGETVSYGWFGTNSRGYMPARVVFGRAWR